MEDIYEKSKSDKLDRDIENTLEYTINEKNFQYSN